ncbi:unnamed protein product [Protopolystoma xenopodis]|uniref:Uncharacterized protein n=1 Tax=Protopolystoma xenopodis TaxID=117903 RepID=A0A3S5B104_9PLAT|nr:unnamed protein product [Protopolystoma xenopodis]
MENRMDLSLELLQMYTTTCPNNPNSFRYLAQWYTRNLQKHPRSDSDYSPLSSPETKRKKTQDHYLALIELYKRLLPCQRPSGSPEGKAEGAAILKDLTTLVKNCGSSGNFIEIVELVFTLLDHPSWALVEECWSLLEKASRKADRKRCVSTAMF